METSYAPSFEIQQPGMDDAPRLWTQYRTPIVAGILIVAIGALAWASMHLRSSLREGQARTELSNAPLAQKKLEIAKHYLGTQTAALALLEVAESQIKSPTPAAAMDTYRLFLENYPKHSLRNAALLGLGTAAEASSKKDEAIQAYQRAIQPPTDTYSALALLSLARIQKQQGDEAGSRQSLQQCASQFASLTYGKQAREQLLAPQPQP